MKKLKSEADVLEAIGAPDFRSIKKENLITFVSNIAHMDNEVAIRCLEQFPEFSNTSVIIIGQLSDVCENIMTVIRQEDQEVMKSYQAVLDDLRFMLEKEDISEDFKRFIIEKEIEVADKIEAVKRRNKAFFREMWQGILGVGSFALMIGGAILGVNFLKKD